MDECNGKVDLMVVVVVSFGRSIAINNFPNWDEGGGIISVWQLRFVVCVNDGGAKKMDVWIWFAGAIKKAI